VKHKTLIFAIFLITCAPDKYVGTILETHPEPVKHATKCYEAIEGPIKGDLPDVEVFIVGPESCSGHNVPTVKGCANKNFVKLVRGRWQDDHGGLDRFEPGHRLVAHEYMHVLYDTLQPDVPISAHHDVFSDEMNSHLECNFIPRLHVH